MNYLAHAYLSFNEPEILAGNLISDFVKGKKKYAFIPGIQRGITLHRAIDRFTDDHPATQRAKEVFKPAYRLYSGAFVDVVYDHFLANDENEFTGTSLSSFSSYVYATLENYLPDLPEKFREIFPYMKQYNWLYNYKYRWGTERSFGGLVRRAAYLTESETASRLFNEHYTTLEACYRSFIGEMKPFARNEFENLMRT